MHAFRFFKTEAPQAVFHHGEVGDLFYLIIKGEVSVLIPNAKIRNWKSSMARYKRL